MEKTIHQKLAEIQRKLKAPKSQKNTFGNYRYRSCEDILEAVKPLLGDLVLTITDEVKQIGDRYYVEATAGVRDMEAVIYVKALAREANEKKGMDEAQITGAASSYARKYALNGLFCIDDTKDADATNDHADKGRAAKAAEAYRKEPKAPKGEVREMKAKYDGICALSGREIKKGDKVVYNPETKKASHKDEYDSWLAKKKADKQVDLEDFNDYA